MKNYFTGTFRRISFIFRKERMVSAVWLGILLAVIAAVAGVFAGVFSSREDLLSTAFLFGTPAMVAMMGPLYGANPTLGSLFASSMLLFTAIAAGIMNIFFVVRNTRAEEEKGRAELLRSLPTGRLTALGAVMIYAFLQNLALGLAAGLILPMLSVESIGFGGSMLFGFCLSAAGMFFAALAALFSQVANSSRGATGISLAALGAFYIMRAAGDIGSEALSLISPLGIILRSECYVSNFWAPVLIVFALAAVFTALAFYFNAIRDSEQGLLPQKNGRREASKFLRSHEGLVWRLARNTLIAWAAGVFIFAAAYGSVMGDMETFIAGNEMLKNMFVPPEGHTATEVFITMIISMLAIVSSVPAAGTMLNLAAEEKQHRYENVFAKAVPRARIFAGYLVVGLIAGMVMLAASMLGLWIPAAVVMEEPIAPGSVISAVAVYLPAVWVITGIAALLVALVPEKASVYLNCYLGFSFLVVYLGEMLKFPEFIKHLTPYGFVPALPLESFNAWSSVFLMFAAAAFIAGGFYFYQKRDLK